MRPCRAKLVIICGLPGAGKTTLAKKLESEMSAIRFCPDEWMNMLSINLYDEGKRGKIEGLQWLLAQQLLAQECTVIIEWGTWASAERETLRQTARTLGAKVELYVLTASLDVLFERVQRRGIEDPPIKKEDIAQWLAIFQEPTADEMALYDFAQRISSK